MRVTNPFILKDVMATGENDFCYRLARNHKDRIHLLKCTRKQAADRIPSHITHAVKIDHIQMALVYSGDTEVYIALMYHSNSWNKDGLRELWTERNDQVSLVHESVNNNHKN